jgi:lysosomal alpha-glucosidase
MKKDRNDISRYFKTIGKPFLPPYWSLGYHQCKFDYGSLDRTKQVLKQTLDAGIPIDVQWNDIDYMDDHKDFTYSKSKFADLPAFVEELHKVNPAHQKNKYLKIHKIKNMSFF